MNHEISEDEDFVEFVTLMLTRRPRLFRERTNHWQSLRDEEFLQRFRLSKQSVWYLFKEIEERIRAKSHRNMAVTADIKLLLTLQFYASGNFIESCSDFCGVDRSTASRIIFLVSSEIAKLQDRYMVMPTGVHAEEVKADFVEKYNLQNCIGVLDTSFVKTSSFEGNDPQLYKNTKGNFGLNIQTVTDGSQRFRSFSAKWPGSKKSSTIFEQSRLKIEMESDEITGALVAGARYPNKPYFIQKIKNPKNEKETLDNKNINMALNASKRCYKMWKRRFPALTKKFKVHLKTAVAAIGATAVLHNIAVEQNEAMPSDDDDEETGCDEEA